MKVKLKECDGCQKMTVIWKNHEGNRYCKNCWSCHKSSSNKLQKPNVSIPRVSSKRKRKDAEYLKLREKYLTQNQLCAVKVKGCSQEATDVHHTYAGSNRDTYYLIQSTWLPACRNCHNWIHEHPKESRILKYLK
jgi:cytochrome c553